MDGFSADSSFFEIMVFYLLLKDSLHSVFARQLSPGLLLVSDFLNQCFCMILLLHQNHVVQGSSGGTLQ